MSNFELYRHFNSNNALLYIGKSYSAFKRLTNGHKRTAHWYEDISRQEIERFPSKEALDKAEVEAIKKEKPLHNKAHNGMCDSKTGRKQLLCVSKGGDEHWIFASPKSMRITSLIEAVGEDIFAEKVLELLDDTLRLKDDSFFGFDQYVECGKFEYYEKVGWGFHFDEVWFSGVLPATNYFNCPYSGKWIEQHYPAKKEARRLVDMLRKKLDGRIPTFNDKKQGDYYSQRMSYILGYVTTPLIKELLAFRRKKPDDWVEIGEKIPTAQATGPFAFSELLAAIGGKQRFVEECAEYIAERGVNIQLSKEGDRRDAVWSFEDYVVETGDSWYDPGDVGYGMVCAVAVNVVSAGLTIILRGNKAPLVFPNKKESSELQSYLMKHLYIIRPTLAGDEKKADDWNKADCYPFLWSFTGKIEQQEEKLSGSLVSNHAAVAERLASPDAVGRH